MSRKIYLLKALSGFFWVFFCVCSSVSEQRGTNDLMLKITRSNFRWSRISQERVHRKEGKKQAVRVQKGKQ